MAPVPPVSGDGYGRGLIGGSAGALAVERDRCLSWVVACRVYLVPLCGLAVAQVGGRYGFACKAAGTGGRGPGSA